MEKMMLKQIAKACYPEYKGRKFHYCEQREYQMTDYWSEGSRNYAIAYEVSTGKSGLPSDMVHNPMNGGAHARFEIPHGVVIVEHSIFCGKDCGITIYAACREGLECDICKPALTASR
jgi:hypothetical protein